MRNLELMAHLLYVSPTRGLLITAWGLLQLFALMNY